MTVVVICCDIIIVTKLLMLTANCLAIYMLLELKKKLINRAVCLALLIN